MWLVVYKRVGEARNFEGEGIKNFAESENREGSSPEAKRKPSTSPMSCRLHSAGHNGPLGPLVWIAGTPRTSAGAASGESFSGGSRSYSHSPKHRPFLSFCVTLENGSFLVTICCGNTSPKSEGTNS